MIVIWCAIPKLAILYHCMSFCVFLRLPVFVFSLCCFYFRGE